MYAPMTYFFVVKLGAFVDNFTKFAHIYGHPAPVFGFRRKNTLWYYRSPQR